MYAALPLLEEVASLAGSQGEGQKLSQLAQAAARTNHLDPCIIQVSDSISVAHRVEHVSMSANGSFLGSK